MIIASIPGRTRELGRGQGFQPLPVADVIFQDDEIPGLQLHVMRTAWQPTPEELQAIIAGAPIILSVYGTTLPSGSTLMDHLEAGSGHPPVMLIAGLPPE